ncbi:phosphatidylinositol kinase- protein kinase tor1, partial [Clydaea vesicula]
MYALIKLTQESNENIPDVINLINKNIIQLINSKDKNNLIVGILVIDQLLEVELDYSDENNMKVTRFANYLRILLKSDDLEVINKSAHTLGRLVKFNRSYNSELVEFEVKRCLEWLQDEKATDSNRFASIRILIELGSLTEVTALLHSFFPQIIDVILKIIINDSKTIIRENGAKCFEVYIKMIILRSSKIPENIARRSFLEIERGVRINSNESIHGSLLILNALLSFHPNTFGAVIDGKYDHICKFVVGKKENKDLMIRKVLISLLEKLATFNSNLKDEVLEVGSVNPVSDFKKLIARRDDDYIATATNQMINRIQEFIFSSHSEDYFEKAINCIKVLKDACSKELEFEIFDSFLKNLKLKCVDQGRDSNYLKNFWNFFLDQKIGLLNESENEK